MGHCYDEKVALQTRTGSVLGYARVHGYASPLHDGVSRWSLVVDDFDFDCCALDASPCVSFLLKDEAKVEGLILSLRKTVAEQEGQRFQAYFLGFGPVPNGAQRTGAEGTGGPGRKKAGYGRRAVSRSAAHSG